MVQGNVEIGTNSSVQAYTIVVGYGNLMKAQAADKAEPAAVEAVEGEAPVATEALEAETPEVPTE